MNKVRELKEKRASLIAEMRSILDTAEKENRDLTGEEESKYEQLEKELEKIDSEIKREERFSRIREIENVVEEVKTADEKKEAFLRYIKTGDDSELRALGTGTGSAGGFLVPTDFYKQVVEAMLATSVMRPLCKVIQTSTTTDIPVLSTHTGASWIQEAGTYGGTDPVFAKVTLGAYKLGVLIRVSEELIQDSAINVEALLAREFANVFALAEDQAFIAGDGSGKPAGVVPSAGVGVTTAASNAITADEIIDFVYSLPFQYRKNAAIIMNDATIAVIRKLKDANGQYLWQPGLSSGQPDRILGIPVYTSPYVPTIAAGARIAVIFDPSYYVIADRGALEVLVLRERYADTGQIAYRATKRVDGKLVLTEAAKALVMKI